MMKTKMICGAATMMLASAPLLAASSSVDQQVRCFVKCNLSDASRRAVSECCRIISRLNVAKPALHRLIEGSVTR